MHKPKGFSLSELMVSVFIIGIIASATTFSLNATRRKDELNTAVRVVAGDLRSLQSRALTGQNIKTCPDNVGVKIVCELSSIYCIDPIGSCRPEPPYGVGAFFVRNTSKYDLFADVDQTKNEWKKTDALEVMLTRDLAMSGAKNVVFYDLVTSASQAAAHVSFQRQNGSMGIDGCYAPTCTAPMTLTIILKHTITNEMRNISLNAYTGRISVD